MREGIADHALAAEPIYLTDLSRCQPADALSSKPRRKHWRTLSYTTDGLEGVMLLAGPETAAPEIHLPLDVDGWHAVSIGVMPAHTVEEGGGLELELRLSDEAVPTLMKLPPDRRSPEALVEMYWKTADLTGRTLVLGQVTARMAPGDGPGSVQCGAARVAYVKLVPLSAPEARTVQADLARHDTRRLFAHQDANGPLGLWRLTSARDIQREVEPYRGTDFSRLYWEVGRGDLMFSHTELGREATFNGLGDFARVFDRLHVESRRVLREQNIDPFDVAADYAHEIGLELHASYRVAGFRFPPPYDHFNWGNSVYEQHPEWRGVNREGGLTPRLAYTYPEVRANVVGLLREMCRRPIDGICLLYCRRPPLVEYEPPLVEAFEQQFGLNPRALDALDPRWLHFRAECAHAVHARGAAGAGRDRRRARAFGAVPSLGGGAEQRRREPGERHRPAAMGGAGSGRHDHSLYLRARPRQHDSGLDRPGLAAILRGPGAWDAGHAGAERDAAAHAAGRPAPAGRGHLRRRRGAHVLLGRSRRRGPGALRRRCGTRCDAWGTAKRSTRGELPANRISTRASRGCGRSATGTWTT